MRQHKDHRHGRVPPPTPTTCSTRSSPPALTSFRLNFSHGTHESQARHVRASESAAKRAGREVAILQDLGGPKIRTGRLEGGRPIRLEPGESAAHRDRRRARQAWCDLDDLRRPGARRQSRRSPAAVGRHDRAAGRSMPTARRSGPPWSKAACSASTRGSTRPGVPLPTSAITLKDVDDLAVRPRRSASTSWPSASCRAPTTCAARQIDASDDGGDVPLIAKLERPQAVDASRRDSRLRATW